LLKVYLACWFTDQGVMKAKADELKTINIDCTSSWVNEEHQPQRREGNYKLDEMVFKKSRAIEDIRDIDRADVLVQFTRERDNPAPGGGRIFEAGYAYGKGKHVVFCGPTENVFCLLPDTKRFDTWEEVKNYLLDYEYIRSKAQARTLQGYATLNDPLGLGGTLRLS